MEELNCETVFTLPIVGGISESVVVTWIIMAVLVLASIILVRNLKVENPGKVQLALEAGIGWAEDFFEGILGKENKGYIPYLITVLLYLACSNTLAPLFGFKPPTKDLNVTAALAIMSMCLIAPSEYNLQFLYTALPHTGDQTMPENLSHRWLLSYPAVLLFHIHCKETPDPVLTDCHPGYHSCR